MFSILELFKGIIILVLINLVFDINFIDDISINIQQHQYFKVFIDVLFIYSILIVI